MRKKVSALLMAAALMVSGAAVSATEKEYIQNGDLCLLSQDTPVHWQLSGGAAVEIPFAEPFPGEEEKIENGGIENLTDGVPDGWHAYWGPWNGNYVKATTEAAYTGSAGIAINGITTDTMTAMYTVENVTPGATYQFSAWGNSMSADAEGSVAANLYAGEEHLSTRRVYLSGAVGTNTWQRVHGTVTLPPDCTRVVLSCAVGSQGTVFFDDFSFYMVQAPAVFTMETEDIFHYAERGTGKVHVTLDPYYETTVTSAKADFSITDESGKTVLSKTGVSFADGEAAWEYSVADFVMRKPYTLTASIKSDLFTGTFTEEIYKYPRPTALGADGTYYDENGEPFVPVIAYWPGELARLPEIGINVAEIGASDPESTLEKLDTLHALGLKALVSLYCGPAYLSPAGHPENMDTTIRVVSAVKDHPAVFAYAMQDEPYGGVAAQMDVWLRDGYRLIRDIDERHPVYLVDYVQEHFKRAGRMADVLAVDPYPFQANSYKVTNMVRAANEAVYGRKPVYAILQTYEGAGFFPTADNVREQVYRALEEGARGVGYYTIDSAIGQWAGKEKKALYETDRWEPMKAYAEKEMPEIMEHFALRKYPVLCSLKEEGTYGLFYEAWAKGDREVYLVVHNRGQSEEAVSVPLRNSGGSVVINGFTAEAVSRGTAAESVSGSTLSVTLAPQEAVFYKIIPNTAINLSLLQTGTQDYTVEYSGGGGAVQTETEGQNAVLLPNTGAAMLQYVYGLTPDSTYALSVKYKGSIQNSTQLYVQYCVRDEAGFFTWTNWSEAHEAPYISGAGQYQESFGKANMENWETVSFHLNVPQNANAMKITLRAAKADPALRIGGISMKEAENNLLANGDFAFTKDTNILTGNWTAYMDYPAQFGNTAELREENGRAYLYMTEASGGAAGRSANARQTVYLYADTVYQLSFLYKDMGNAPRPTVCLYNMSAKGHVVEKWPAPAEEANGWKRYSVCFSPVTDDAYMLWLGGQNATGAYAFSDVSLLPAEGNFFTSRETTAVGTGCAEMLDSITELAQAESGKTGKVVHVRTAKKENVRIGIYGGGNVPELVALQFPENTLLTQVTVPEGGMTRVFVWQTGSMQPAMSAVTLK